MNEMKCDDSVCEMQPVGDRYGLVVSTEEHSLLSRHS